YGHVLIAYDGELDPASLPAMDASTAPDASVFVVSMDDPTVRVEATFELVPGPLTEPFDQLLVVTPARPLPPATTWAVVVTAGLLGADGMSVRPAADFEAAFADAVPSDPELIAAHAELAPLRAVLPSLEFDEDIVVAAVFTTRSTTLGFEAARVAVAAF